MSINLNELKKVSDLTDTEMQFIKSMEGINPQFGDLALEALTQNPIIIANGSPEARIMLAQMFLIGHSNPLNDIKGYHGMVFDDENSY